MYWTDEKLVLVLESISVQNKTEGFSMELCMISHFLYVCVFKHQYVFCLSRVQVCVWTCLCRNSGLWLKKEHVDDFTVTSLISYTVIALLYQGSRFSKLSKITFRELKLGYLQIWSSITFWWDWTGVSGPAAGLIYLASLVPNLNIPIFFCFGHVWIIGVNRCLCFSVAKYFVAENWVLTVERAPRIQRKHWGFHGFARLDVDIEEKERLFWELSSSRLVIFWEGKKPCLVVRWLQIPFLGLYFFWGGTVYLSQNQVQNYLVQNQVWLSNASLDGMRADKRVIVTDEHCGTWPVLPVLPLIPAAAVPGKSQSHILSFDKIILSVSLFTCHSPPSLMT